MRILFLTKRYRKGVVGDSYYCDFLDAMKMAAEVYEYGPGYESFDYRHTIHDLVSSCKAQAIICGQGWLKDTNPAVCNPNDVDPHPGLNLALVNIPKVMIINKEYKQLDPKFGYALRSKIDCVFTVLHRYAEWEEQYKIPVRQLPFAVDPNVFKKYDEPKKYEIGFSGALHAAHISIRQDMVERINKMGLNFLCRIEGLGLPTGEAYARMINGAKLWLSTTSAAEIVGPRFWEVMASETLLICNRSSVYGNLFQDGVHCIMDGPDLEEKIKYYIHNGSRRRQIEKAARQHMINNHTWGHRARTVIETIKKLL